MTYKIKLCTFLNNFSIDVNFCVVFKFIWNYKTKKTKINTSSIQLYIIDIFMTISHKKGDCLISLEKNPQKLNII